jgi:glyoxylase-like metal-dependent hydrolase (beta-lactamase superfamily II)
VHWQIGDVRVTRVRETDLNGFSAKQFFGLGARELDPFRDWLAPYLGPADMVLMSVHALCIEADGLRIVVDTCIGNDRNFGDGRTLGMFNGLHTSFLEDLTAAGFGRDAVDRVICTHLHADHVGWNTLQEDGLWVPTFRRARYVLSKADVEYWRGAGDAALSPFGVSVQPLLERGRVDAVALDHRISPSVCLMPTPGHTPGHVSVRIESRGETAVITGDMVHSPVQLARPEWSSIGDVDPDEAIRSRRSLLQVAGGTGALVMGTHFPGRTAGRVERDGPSWRFV